MGWLARQSTAATVAGESDRLTSMRPRRSRRLRDCHPLGARGTVRITPGLPTYRAILVWRGAARSIQRPLRAGLVSTRTCLLQRSRTKRARSEALRCSSTDRQQPDSSPPSFHSISPLSRPRPHPARPLTSSYCDLSFSATHSANSVLILGIYVQTVCLRCQNALSPLVHRLGYVAFTDKSRVRFPGEEILPVSFCRVSLCGRASSGDASTDSGPHAAPRVRVGVELSLFACLSQINERS